MRKLWNRPDLPVWSISTVSANDEPNMNTATYVTAVSMDPKLVTLAVYRDTKTLENMLSTKRCLLQLLSEPLAPAVRVCGYTSGKTVDKITRLEKRYTLGVHAGLYYFTDAAGFLELETIDEHDIKASDHVLLTMRVVTHKNLNDTPLLTTGILRERGIIR